MLPPASKAEVQETLEDASIIDREQRQAQANDAAANISAAIKTLGNVQSTQTAHEDRRGIINVLLSATYNTAGLLDRPFHGIELVRLPRSARCFQRSVV